MHILGPGCSARRPMVTSPLPNKAPCIVERVSRQARREDSAHTEDASADGLVQVVRHKRDTA